MKSILLLLMGCILLFVLTIITGRITFAHQYKIRSKTGIQRSEYITIGKIKQYIQIRGQDSSNPVILMLHGGPGNPMAYYSYDWQAELEQDYTVIHWDQRGCGNTFYQNKTAAKPTLDLLLSDLDELVDHIRLEFQKEKVILMGHSWGTFPGAIYAGSTLKRYWPVFPSAKCWILKNQNRYPHRKPSTWLMQRAALRMHMK
mgnify:CR=1 FL=1